jgi:CRP/FNR family transcriptional regulator
MRHPFFRGLLSPDAVTALNYVSIAQYARGQALFHAGDPASSIYLLFSGVVKKTYVSPGGEEKIISISLAGDIFGELFLGKYRHRIATATVLEEARVGRLQKVDLMTLITKFPQLSLNLIGHLVDEQRETLARLHALMHMDARYRLLGTILSLARRACCPDKEWVELPLSITQDDLASIACLNRSTVNIHVNDLRAQHILGGKGRRVMVNRRAVERVLREAGVEILV